MLFLKFYCKFWTCFCWIGLYFWWKTCYGGLWKYYLQNRWSWATIFKKSDVFVLPTAAHVFTPFQRVKQMHDFLHLFFKRWAITLLCLWVQVGSYTLLFQLDFFLQRIILYPRIKSFLNLYMFYPIWVYRLSMAVKNFAFRENWVRSER